MKFPCVLLPAYQSESVTIDQVRGRDPYIDPARPAIVPDPRSESIDPGTGNAWSNHEPANYGFIKLNVDASFDQDMFRGTVGVVLGRS